MKRVGLYIRVSTQDQSLDLQRTELLRYAESRGWVVTEVYEDKATGANENRPQLRRLKMDAYAREFDILLIWRLDRLARSLKDLLNSIQTFEELGIAFVSLKDNVDLTTSSGRLMLAIIGAMAEFERSLIVSRVRAGLAEAKRKGVKLGRHSEVDIEVVKKLAAKKKSLREIAKTTGYSKSAIQRALKRAS